MVSEEIKQKQYLANLYIARFEKEGLLPQKGGAVRKPTTLKHIAKSICHRAAENIPPRKLPYKIEQLERAGYKATGKPSSLINNRTKKVKYDFNIDYEQDPDYNHIHGKGYNPDN